MKIKLIAAAALALVCGVQASYAEDFRIAYTEKSLSDPQVRKMWAAEASSAQPLGQYSPWVLVATKDIGDGRTLTISQLWAGGACAAAACPLKVYEGDQFLASMMACSEPQLHTISDDGRMIFACDDALRTNRK
jgi:hypothetical protein